MGGPRRGKPRLYMTFFRCLWHPDTNLIFHYIYFHCIYRPDYFQLQLGCVLTPLDVNFFTFVPSASIVHIWSLPER